MFIWFDQKLMAIHFLIWIIFGEEGDYGLWSYNLDCICHRRFCRVFWRSDNFEYIHTLPCSISNFLNHLFHSLICSGVIRASFMSLWPMLLFRRPYTWFNNTLWFLSWNSSYVLDKEIWNFIFHLVPQPVLGVIEWQWHWSEPVRIK